jgi:hypothetical protein
LIEALPVPPATAMTIAGMAKKLRHHPAWRGPLGGAPRSITSRTPSGGGASSIRPLGLLDESMCPTQTFNINLGTSSDPDIEKQVLSDQASYGKQLGRIGEALIVLLNHVNLTNMTRDEEKAIYDLKFMLHEMANVKDRYGAQLVPRPKP